MSADRLAGKRVLVVGAGTQHSDEPDAPVGNGRAIAVLAAREGAAVVCADRDAAAAEATAAMIRSEGGEASVIVADVTLDDDCARLGSGQFDGLVLNVGISRGRRLAETTAKDWDLTFAVNLRSHFLVTQAALPNMAEGGSIVFVGSIAGVTPGSQMPAYDASKAGLLGLSRQVAIEAARRNIRANVLAPGLIDTPIGRAASAGRPSRERSPVPLGRHGTAWEIAGPAVFLLSDEAAYITGQTLVVDGGLTLI